MKRLPRLHEADVWRKLRVRLVKQRCMCDIYKHASSMPHPSSTVSPAGKDWQMSVGSGVLQSLSSHFTSGLDPPLYLEEIEGS